MENVTQEVRSSFTSVDEITLLSVSKLDYMLACLHETLRMYPPVGQGIVRETGKNGQHVAGKFVPPGVFVEVQPWAINHDPRNWSNPWEFNPERFLKFDEEGNATEALQPFLNANVKTVTNAFGDHVEALQPFSVGVRTVGYLRAHYHHSPLGIVFWAVYYQLLVFTNTLLTTRNRIAEELHWEKVGANRARPRSMYSVLY